jgi:fluoroacetyl-CoA thioesterase
MPDTTTQFPIGLAGEARITVTNEVTAKHLGSGTMAVFATPEMVRLMERAAVAALADHLEPGQQSVGTLINVRHLAAAPVGAVIVAQAELIGIEGRRLTFRVSATDGIDIIGDGLHQRAIIDLAQFQQRVEAKKAALDQK